MFESHTDATQAEGSFTNSAKEPRNMGPGPRILRALQKETGLGAEKMNLVKKRHPGDPLRQVDEFFDIFYIPAATGRKRTASEKTELAYRVRLTTAVKKLSTMNMPVKNLDEIGPKQVKLMFKQFEKDGWSASWMANVNTVVRRFGIWIGKPDLCPRLPLLLDQPWSAQRRYAATEPKDWESKQVDHEMYFCKIELVSPITALQLRLAKAFGVRVQEFLMFRPESAQRGEHIYIKDGTKGGRPRLVPIETEEQRELLKQAKEHAQAHPLGILVAKKGLNLKKAIDYFYNTVKRVGISRKVLGVTAHGLRHGYACKVYKQLTGEEAPVLGGKFVDPVVDKKARLEIAERLGHSRKDVVSAYIGSHRTFSKVKKENMDRLEQVLEKDPALIAMAASVKLSRLCVLGAASQGEPLNGGSVVAIGFEAVAALGQSQGAADDAAFQAMSEMANRVGSLLGVCGAAVRLSCVQPDMPIYSLSKLETKATCAPKMVRKVETEPAAESGGLQ